MVSRLQILSMGLSGLLSLSAHAGRPLATEDAGVLASGACEWESMGSRLSSDEPVSRAWMSQLGCGVGLGTQLALGAGRSHGNGSHEHAITVAGKTGLIEDDEHHPALTLAYNLNLLRAAGAGFQLDNQSVALVLSQPLGAKFTGHANLGWLRDRGDHQSSTTWNLAIETYLSDNLEAGVEWYGDDHSRPWGGLGLRWSLTECFNLNASLAARAGASSDRLLTVGAKLGF